MKKNYITYVLVWIVCLLLGVGIGYAANMDMDMDHSTDTMDHSSMDPMQMSMADMGAMLEGKTWDELNKAFLEGMIPHHQWAIEMAQVLENSNRPELQEMGREIIEAQQAEIDQMNEWLVEWGYTTN